MYLGDFNAGDTIDLKFTTVGTTGAPTTLAGTPAISVYKSNSVTQSTAGITLTVDFDSITGMHHVQITTATDATFYAGSNDFQIVITTGTVGGTSVIGYVVGAFSLSNRAVKPQTGDSFARLGAPAGASIAADLVTIDNLVDDLESRLGTPSNLGTGATVAANLVDIEAQTDDIGIAGAGLTAIPAGGGDSTGVTTLLTRIPGVVQAQTGDSFARLGTPAVASVSADIAAIEAQTDDIGAAGAGLTAVPWNAAWDAEIQSEVADALDVAIPATPTANSINERIKAIDDKLPTGNLSDLTVAQVNTEVLDVLNVDTFAEPGQEDPPATTTLVKKIGYIYKFLRNKIVQSSTTSEVYNDAGTVVDQKSAVSDTGLVLTRGKFLTGP